MDVIEGVKADPYTLSLLEDDTCYLPVKKIILNLRRLEKHGLQYFIQPQPVYTIDFGDIPIQALNPLKQQIFLKLRTMFRI